MLIREPLPLGERLVYAIPLLGWMLKDVVHGERGNIYYFLFAILAGWGVAIIAFGYPAVILPLLALLPVVFATLVLITLG